MSINLTKGQKISLEKESGSKLSKITMGLGWDAVKTSKSEAPKKGFLSSLFGGNTSSEADDSIDLDASCVMFDVNKNIVDTVWFRQLVSNDGSVIHTGDNRTGSSDGDDEQINVDLARVPQSVNTLFFVVNSFTGQNFSQVANAYCRIVDADTNKEIAKYDLSCQGNHTAMAMTKIYRHNGDWKMHAIGENGSGATFEKLMPLMQNYL
ncbi:MAG: TerD family protein [Candidatus Sericytochromatia bacterium]|nr:TerD family protein [Candidatus Sericytochromatia bacterium]